MFTSIEMPSINSDADRLDQLTTQLTGNNLS